MSKITYENKIITTLPARPEMFITAQDLNEIKTSVNDLYDIADSNSVNIDNKENALGNPDDDNYVLSSKKDGTRSWIAMSGGSGVVDSVNANNVNIIDSGNRFNATETESALEELVTKTDVNGYDRYNPNSMPDVTLSTRTVNVAVKSGQSSFHFWVNNKKVIKTTTQSVTIPDITGGYYIYFDDNGVLQYILQENVASVAFYKYAITAFVYWNASNSSALFNPDELHGKDMPGVTHESLHMTVGARYSSGLDIEGLVDAEPNYTQSTSGVIYDEDIAHTLAANSTGHKMLYRFGPDGAWRTTSADLNVGHTEGGSYYTWNQWTGTTWQWTEGTSDTDYWITFFIAMPNGVVKLAGQNAYPSRNKARAAIETEVANISTNGLPNPEFVWLGAVIVRRNGDLENMADGTVFYDLKHIRGSGTLSSGTTYADDVPVSTSNFDTLLSITDTTVQTALNTLDDHTHDNRYYTEAETDALLESKETVFIWNTVTGIKNIRRQDIMKDFYNARLLGGAYNGKTFSMKESKLAEYKRLLDREHIPSFVFAKGEGEIFMTLGAFTNFYNTIFYIDDAMLDRVAYALNGIDTSPEEEVADIVFFDIERTTSESPSILTAIGAIPEAAFTWKVNGEIIETVNTYSFNESTEGIYIVELTISATLPGFPQEKVWIIKVED